jgi:hypothetical protein
MSIDEWGTNSDDLCEPEDTLTLQETELLEKYDAYKLYKVSLVGTDVTFQLWEIVQLAKLCNE